MSNALKRDVPTGAAAVIVAVALLASVVTGREQPPAPPAVTAPPEQLAPGMAAVEAIDVSRLARDRREVQGPDLFASPAPPLQATAPSPAIQAPGTPSAPPLPYAYLGQMRKGDRLIVYLLKGQELLLAESGQALESHYAIDAVSESAVTFVYVPLNTRQVLTIPSRPQ